MILYECDMNIGNQTFDGPSTVRGGKKVEVEVFGCAHSSKYLHTDLEHHAKILIFG